LDHAEFLRGAPVGLVSELFAELGVRQPLRDAGVSRLRCDDLHCRRGIERYIHPFDDKSCDGDRCVFRCQQDER